MIFFKKTQKDSKLPKNVRQEMDRRAKLRTLCETRWASRDDALYAFRAAFPVVVQALETLSQDGNGKARGYLRSFKRFDSVIVLCVAEHVISKTVALSTMLLAKERRSHLGTLRSESDNNHES